ncbi:hypothetical protein [Shewanella dokdonensis]|uniref:Uncharacterized protein n=1 Tax=Shewanella dokdonensis TaxID=712036 RepID=A0ABX8DFY6_9GAMM|nr:hypothetical protein [Shewanella dokdonensis]MCL1076479.1 hypothetical protein [Shewanella dokdonensis]QVK23300.1 hypothetical protein KHX94_00180 [Shewanella dokdonensis]
MTPTFKHLCRHMRAAKRELMAELLSDKDALLIASCLGKLECIYWQALGNGELTLAKGIVRLIQHSYRFHNVHVSSCVA